MTPAFSPTFDPSAATAALVAWYRANRKAHPWRSRFAATGDPYVVWVSEIMLQQTVIKAVLPVYERFLARFPDVATLAAASEEDVRAAVRGLGYYRRFRMLHAAAKEVAATGPSWPRTATAWKALPGIGDYTSAAIASIAFGEPVAVVDGNVERVLARLIDWRKPAGLPSLKRPFKALAQQLVEPTAPGDSNQALMELGQTICTPLNPACERCPIATGCLARERASTQLAPAAKERAAPRDVRLELHVVRDPRGRIGLIERPPTARFLKGALGFPTAVVDAKGSRSHDGAALPLATRGELLGEVRHGITHHRITAAVVVSDKAAWPAGAAWSWVAASAVEERLIANLDRKAWNLWRKSDEQRTRSV
jgi:A/G-specific adenine glycosylase